MNIKVDASGLDEFIEEIENEVSTAMINAAHSAVDTQKTSNISNKKHIKIIHGTCGMLRELSSFGMGRLSICMYRLTVPMEKRKSRRKVC